MDTRVDLGTQLIDAPLISFSLSTWCLSAVVVRHWRAQKTTYPERTFKKLLSDTSRCSLAEFFRGQHSLWHCSLLTHLLEESRVKSWRLLHQRGVRVLNRLVRLKTCAEEIAERIQLLTWSPRRSRDRSGRSNGHRSSGGNSRRVDSALDLVGLGGLRGSSEGPQLASGGFGHGFFESLDEGWLRG